MYYEKSLASIETVLMRTMQGAILLSSDQSQIIKSKQYITENQDKITLHIA